MPEGAPNRDMYVRSVRSGGVRDAISLVLGVLSRGQHAFIHGLTHALPPAFPAVRANRENHDDGGQSPNVPGCLRFLLCRGVVAQQAVLHASRY